MSRQPQNQAFQVTSFLNGANAAYIEEMQSVYEQNPGSVSDEWRLFFESLHDTSAKSHTDTSGPSWAVPMHKLEQGGEMIAALTGNYDQLESGLRDRLHMRSQQSGFEMSPAASGAAAAARAACA